METFQKIFVTGATGNLGGASARNLLRQGFHVKALVRDRLKLNADKNLEIIKGDLNDPGTYRQYLQDCDAVFCNLSYDQGTDKEISQGVALIDLSKHNNIKHVVYSSVIGCDLDTGIPHWESKNRIEHHIKTSGLNHTILRPSSLYENFLRPQVKSRILKGKLVLPTKKYTVQQFISAEDVGRITTRIFSDPEKFRSKTIHLAAEQMNGEQLAAAFTKAMQRQIKFQQLPMFITRLVMGRDLTKMFKWVDNNNSCFVKDLQAFKNEFGGVLSLEEWIKIHFK